MRQYLEDIVRFTSPLGFDAIKVTGSDKDTVIEALTPDMKVVLKGKTKKPVADLEGTFGLSNLALLNGLLSFPNYKGDNASITMKRRHKEKASAPEEILFNGGDSEAAYRLMSGMAVPKQPEFKASKAIWVIENVFPEKSKIAEFEYLSKLLSNFETMFSIKHDDKGVLKFFVGDVDASNHKLNMVFAKDVAKKGNIGGWKWPVEEFLSVLKLGNKNATVAFAEQGLLLVECESDYSTYQFFIPGHQ